MLTMSKTMTTKKTVSRELYFKGWKKGEDEQSYKRKKSRKQSTLKEEKETQSIQCRKKIKKNEN